MAATCRFAAPLGLAPLPRSCAGAKSVAFSIGTTKVATRTRSVAVRAGDGSAETPEILKAAQDAWAKVEDKYAVATIGVAGLVALWTAVGALKSIDKLPILPGVLELVGIGYTGVSSSSICPRTFCLSEKDHVYVVRLLSSLTSPKCCYFVFIQWFTYRNLIFQPDRETLISNIKSTYNEITGSSS
ncbi:unnamed protein product [Triticum aestivum]|uniref:Cyanobacterial aminoacyl-tRNA synthetase CAAD domain-containing protein n=1 Tax=Triticum aestivum TaxID=4565 RepID=A0A7H4LGG6_WHEAT|nr:protein CURVATURE THYLAKOID 1B, chloroplastic isoform X1 [Aegilops tauschii subsp. strangulata]XP_044331944.1 protein CURVATURE THYLAKOID 1B, chloroplastic-like isoform X1 [Triticum aestivum]SPT17704.1 unnamed protein product [Triticum aestivum]